MNRGIWVIKKNMLCKLVKKVGEQRGVQDVDELREYCKDLLKRYPDESIEEAITCFEELLREFE